MSDVSASYGMLLDFIAFLGIFFFQIIEDYSVVFLHQTFTDCVTNLHKHIDMLTCQM